MPPRGVKSAKRARQYEHIKDAELQRGVGTDRAEEIAARTVNKQRRQAGETKAAPTRTSRAATDRKSTAKAATKTTGKRTARKTTRKVASKKR